MSIFEIFQMVGQNTWLYGGAFILVLSVLVFVHEWGHYIVAKMCGIKVETFSIGFGKEIAGFHDKKGTRWKISLIPLGGYVKLYGDVDPASAGHTENVKEGEGIRPMTEAEKQQAFFAKPVWKRALVVIAGPAINYVFAILILTLLFTFNGQPVTPSFGAAIIQGSSADQNGFLPHDEVLSIDGNKIYSFEDIRREMMIALDEEKHFEIKRDGKVLDIYARPEKVIDEDRFGFKHSRGLLGLISPRNAIQMDIIKAIDGVVYEDKDALRKALLAKMGQSFTITIPGAEKDQVLKIKPVLEYNADLENEALEEPYVLYISNVDANQYLQYPVHVSFGQALQETWDITRGTVEALGQMIMGTRSATELGGIIRIGALAGDMAQQGVIALILFTALLSINLGLINLFPIPMLDGGHLMFYFFEAILRRPIPEQIQEYAFRAGFMFLVALMVFANLNDIIQLFI